MNTAINISKIIQDYQLFNEFTKGSFGIEKEGLRTTLDQKLAMTDHPKTLGSRSYHPYLQTDFSEAQPEIVTPPESSIEETYQFFIALHDVLHQSMAADEYIWPFSMPNILPEESEIPIIRVENQADIDYREQLAEDYGKKLQTISGIHYNFSFRDEFIQKLFEHQDIFDDFIQFKNQLYVKLASNFLRYEWILTYLYGAAPYAEAHFYERESGDLKAPETYLRSIRKSEYGYHNDDEVVVRVDSAETYVADIERYVNEGILSEEREFYGNARLRGKGKRVREMLNSGVQYIEFRSFDLNPFSELGFSKRQAKLIHLFFMAMLWVDENATTEAVQFGQERNIEVANEYPHAQTPYKAEGLEILALMQKILKHTDLDEEYQRELDWAVSAFDHPQKTYAGQLVTLLDEISYLDLGQKWGLAYKKLGTEKPYRLRGFEDFELSTQLLIFDALQLGVEVEILDATDQFIKLAHEDHIEYVRKGNMTSHDSTISHFIMENKTVTKKILKDANIQVPGGEEFRDLKEAIAAYPYHQGAPLVVKPKSTNYGLGITVFKEAPDKDSYEEAMKIAFQYDDQVLAEEYAPGTEYRFFVLSGKTEAVLLRVPANVVGDGHSTISALIDSKNEDPLRGEHHLTPMGKLGKGQEEKLTLKAQGYNFDTVLEAGERAFLRENSNISTGGDSIDMTDQMHPSYLRVAESIANALEVQVTGVDLIIPDKDLASTEENPGYICLEANFNPAMSMHTFVTKGQGRRLTRLVLKMLFPELDSKSHWIEEQK